MNGGKDWLEVVLKRKAYQDTPIKLLTVEEGGCAPGKGENYLSEIQKIRAKVLLGSGRIKNVSLLVKNEPKTEHLKRMSVDGGIFQKEIMMYRDILPKMQELLEEINDPDGIFWAKCYDLRLYDRLVLEDLGASGYRMENRKKQMSLNAALMAVKHFAKFHALSRILLDRGEIPIAVFGEHLWMKRPESEEVLKKTVASSSKRMCQKMETWGDGWKEAIERLAAADLGPANIASYRAQPDEFVVLCHGDTWTNNMMFQGEDLENPTSIRLVDFQICHLNSPGSDLNRFFVSSLRLEDRKLNINLLIHTYTETLRSYLLKLGYKGDVPSVEDVQRSLEFRAAMRLSEAISFVPIVMGEPEDAPDLEEIMKNFREATDGEEVEDGIKFGPPMNLSPTVEAILKHELETAMESGLI